MSHDWCIWHCYAWKQSYNSMSTVSAWHPISFFSRKMTPAETRYSTFNRELLAVYLAIKHFHHFLEGRHFHVLTDHKTLTFALNTNSDCHSPCQACQLDYISQFTSTIHHVYGLDNVVADALPVLRLICYSLVNHPLWTLLLWLRHTPLTHRFKLSSPPHLLHWLWKLSHWLTLAHHFTVTRPLEHNTPSSHWYGNVLCLTPFMVCLIQESEQPRSSLQSSLYGLVSMQMLTAGLVPMYSASVPRFGDTLLKAQPQPDSWMDVLPFFLLGIHTTLKEDIS